MTNQAALESILNDLKKSGQMPARIDFSIFADQFWCVVSDNKEDDFNIISDSIYTGHSKTKEVSLLKALSERVERKAFGNGYQKGLVSCQTERSDGFAAYPKMFTANKAKENALAESIERFVWANWWDYSDYGHTVQTIAVTDKKSDYVEALFKKFDLETVYVITPHIQNSDYEVQIVFAKIKNQGFISGGACGLLSEKEQTFERALDELFRHGFSYQRVLEKNLTPTSFYEKRLCYFASGQGNDLVTARVFAQGTQSIVLPQLEIDSEVPTNFQSYSVHRCYFQNQPVFVGGKLERLCL